MPEGKYFWLKCQLNGLCLDLSNGKAEAGNDVITWEFRGADNQLWYQDRANNVIRSKLNNNIVLEQRKDGHVIVNTFEPGKPEQQWKVVGNKVCRRNNENCCLEIIDGKKEHAALLCAKNYDGKACHMWDAEHLEAEKFAIVSQMHGKALDIAGAEGGEGAKVIVWDYHGGSNQQWYEDKYGIIRSKLNKFTFKLSGEKVVMAKIPEGDPQACWMRSEESIFNLEQPQFCLEISGGSRDNSASITQGQNMHSEHQRWNFQPIN